MASIDEAIVFFSTGKDSIATLDLCCKNIKTVKAVYLYFVKGISFRDKIIKYYENKYRIKIDQYPQVDLSSVFKNNSMTAINKKIKRIKQPDIERYVRQKYDIPWLVYGYKKTDSLSRRGILNTFDGVDCRNKKIYPLADWNNKDVFNYIKKQRLPLPEDYSLGFRDTNFYYGDSLLWIYNNYPADYQKIKKVYPFIDADRLRNE
jgi:3'-phosphoadenosine 5'-phosphosulfate sulfotransferase (PAPS reductase)/FAD synthetase